MSRPAEPSEGTAAAADDVTSPHSRYLRMLTSVDAVTFTLNRPYPAWIVGSDMAPYQALLRIVVKRPSVAGGLARVIASAELREPAPRAGVSAAPVLRARPRPVVEDAEFFFDPADGNFYQSGPIVTTIDCILDTVYYDHCRTLHWHVRLRAAVITCACALRDRVVHGGHDVVRMFRAWSAGRDVVGAPRA